MPGRVYYSDIYEDDLGGVSRPGSRARQKNVRLGNELELVDMDDFSGVSTDTGFSEFEFQKVQRIVSANANDFPGAERSGSWVLTVDADYTVTGASLQYAPIVAKVTFGAGGIQNNLYIDAFRGSISIPAPDVIVSVGHTKMLGTGGVLGPNAGYAPEAKVRATLQRSNEGSGESSILTRNFYMAPSLSATMPIPPFATAWAVANEYDPDGTVLSGLSNVLIKNSRTGSTLDRVTDTIADSMKRTLCFRPLPPQARFMTFTTDSDVPTGGLMNSILFKIGF